AEHLLGNVGTDELWCDWRNPADHDVPQITFQVVVLGVAVAAESENGRLAGFVASLARQVFGRVRLGATRLPAIVEFSRSVGHEISGFELHPALGKRVLDALVLTNRTVENDALLRICDGMLQRRPAN